MRDLIMLGMLLPMLSGPVQRPVAVDFPSCRSQGRSVEECRQFLSPEVQARIARKEQETRHAAGPK